MEITRFRKVLPGLQLNIRLGRCSAQRVIGKD